MPEIEYTPDDVSHLAGKIGSIEMSEVEHALMAAILGIASDVIASRDPAGGVSVSTGDRSVIEYDSLPELGTQVSRTLDPSADAGLVARMCIIPGG